MKRSRRRSGGSFGHQSDVSFSDTEEYRPRSGSGLAGERGNVDDRHKTELRRLKNREAARRVRERKSNQLNAYKSQVDDLKRENQKLLQIIAQLQNASLGCLSGGAVATNTNSTRADGDDGPAGTVTTSCPSAGVQHDSIDSGPSGVRFADGAAGPLLTSEPSGTATAPAQLQVQHQQHQKQQKVLGSVPSWPLAAAGGAPDTNASGSCVLSQPINTSAVLSSTMQLLSGWHSAPHLQPAGNSSGSRGQPQPQLHTAATMPGPNQVLLQRSCGCCGEEECEECEGVRVTLSSASNLPLVTTPGPRPKLLTLEDLKLHGLSGVASAHQHNTGSLTSGAHHVPCRASGSSLVGHRGDASTAPQQAAAGGGWIIRSHDSPDVRFLQQQQHRQQHRHRPGQETVSEQEGLTGMDVDLVGTLEPSSRVGVMGLRLDSHSSSGHAVFGSAPAAAAGQAVMGDRPGSCTESCYVRKSSSNRAAAMQQQWQQQQQQQQGEEGGVCAAPMGGQAAQQMPTEARDAAAAAAAEDAVKRQVAAILPAPQFGLCPPAIAAAGAGGTRVDGSMAAPVFTVTTAAAAGTYPGLSGAPVPADVPNAGLQNFKPLQLQQQQLQPQPASPPGNGSSKPAHKLMRTIAAAVGGLVRSGRRNSGSSAGTPRDSSAAAAAALAQEERQQQLLLLQQHGLAPTSVSAHVMLPVSQGYNFSQPAAAGAASKSFSAGTASPAAPAACTSSAAAAAASSGMMLSNFDLSSTMDTPLAMQQQQQMLLVQQQMQSEQVSNAFVGDAQTAAGLKQQQQQMLLQLQLQQQQLQWQQLTQQQQPQNDDSVIMAAQLMLQRQTQQRRAAAAAADSPVSPQQRQQQQQQHEPMAAAAQAADSSGGSRRPSAMDTTPIWPGDDGPEQHLQQQQQASVVALSEPQLLAAAVLPLDFQASYTDGFLAGDAAAAGGDRAGVQAVGGAAAVAAGDEDAVMVLARQEGVLINSDELQSLF